MFISKKLRKADKSVSNLEEVITDSEGFAVITIKASDKSQIFSAYDYDSNEKLNEELGNYIKDETRFVPIKKDVRLKIYTSKDINQVEVENAIRNKFKKDYNEIKSEKKGNLLFCLSMLIVGILFLSMLLLSNVYFPNIYLEIILEVGTWVFIWEAIDAFFLRGMQLKNKQIRYLKIVTAKIEVIELEDIKELD